MDAILRRLDAIHTELETPAEHFRGALLAERDGLIDQLGALYLTATPRARGAVRRFVAARRRLGAAMEDRTAWHAYRVKTADDDGHLRLGLAAASMCGGADPRDFGFVLQHLISASVRAGIDPRPHAREVAALSGKRRAFLRLCSLTG